MTCVALACDWQGSAATPPTKKAVRVHANIGQVAKRTTTDGAGHRTIKLVIRTTQSGVQFFGRLNLACEITDGAGQRYFGECVAIQDRGYDFRSECEWTCELKTEAIRNPSLSGYAVQYSAPDVSSPLDEKSFGCSAQAVLKKRNEKSKPLTVVFKAVRLVGGKD